MNSIEVFRVNIVFSSLSFESERDPRRSTLPSEVSILKGPMVG